MINLVCWFRSQGVQWPLRAGDVVLVWEGLTLRGELSAELVIEVIQHALYSAHLTTRVMASTPLRRPLAKAPMVSLAVQTARRLKRRKNSAHH